MRRIKIISFTIIALLLSPAVSIADYSSACLNIVKIDFSGIKVFLSATDNRPTDIDPIDTIKQNRPLPISAQIEEVARSQNSVKKSV